MSRDQEREALRAEFQLGREAMARREIAESYEKEINKWKNKYEALKKDARLLALEDLQSECWNQQGNRYRMVISDKAKAALLRIIEATKGENKC